MRVWILSRDLYDGVPAEVTSGWYKQRGRRMGGGAALCIVVNTTDRHSIGVDIGLVSKYYRIITRQK